MMGIFRKAGEKFEETKRAFKRGEGETYACTSCEQSVSEDHEHCPHCGEETIEPVE